MRRRLAGVLLALAGLGTTTTVEVDLLNQMSCDASALTDVRGVLIWVSPGTHALDNLRAQ
ncbi:hypothetical protein GCM10010169_14200 [Micromonospora fulviviridis]|uniref:hypothetical protein n=1 Tax=Micromonospora fulviviridis TaxID=47860 RepID=UPI001664FB46|nr:hypothetical protein [Micromonospora fulviviridis]GGR71513.1 hypothetical protein GCM10010169_14200 [Micromonospora fulviviridis]